MNKHLIKFIPLIAAFISMLYSEQPITKEKIADPHIMCIPATYLPGSRIAQIHKKLLGKTEFEFVIFLTGTMDNSYPATVVYKTENGFLCDLRKIEIVDLIDTEGNFDAELIEKSTVHSKSRMIDEKTVETLRKTLLNQVKKARYPTGEKEASLKEPILDGSTNTVYVKANQDDLLDYYGAILRDEGNSSFSCSEIEFALELYVTRPEDKNLSAVLRNITKYIEKVSEGKDPGPDPMYRVPEKEPETIPTIEELLENE